MVNEPQKHSKNNGPDVFTKNVDDGKLKKLRNHENMYIEKTWKKNQKIDKNLTSKNIVHNGQV